MAWPSGDDAGEVAVGRDATVVVVDATVLVDEEDDDELVVASTVIDGGAEARLPPPFEQDARSAAAVTMTATSRAVLGRLVPAIPGGLWLGGEQPAQGISDAAQQLAQRIGGARRGAAVGRELGSRTGED